MCHLFGGAEGGGETKKGMNAKSEQEKLAKIGKQIHVIQQNLQQKSVTWFRFNVQHLYYSHKAHFIHQEKTGLKGHSTNLAHRCQFMAGYKHLPGSH